MHTPSCINMIPKNRNGAARPRHRGRQSPHTHRLTHTHNTTQPHKGAEATTHTSVNSRLRRLLEPHEVFTVVVENNDWLAGAWSASDGVGDSELCCRQLLCFRGKDGGGGGGKERNGVQGGRDRKRMGRDLAGCYELTVAPGGKLYNCLWNMTQENGRR